MHSYLPDSVPLHERGANHKGSLLFLHANSYSAELYRGFLEPLESEYRITSPDLPGHGDSQWSGRIKSWEELADYYLGILNLEDASEPKIGMGHSIGGILIMFMAIKRPNLFSKIILLDPVLPPKHILYILRVMRPLSLTHLNPLSQAALRRKTRFTSAERAHEHYGRKQVFAGWKPEFLQAYVDTCMRTGADGSVQLACRPELESSIYQSLPPKVWSLPRKISTPALYIAGSHSDTIDGRGLKRLRRKVGHERVKLVEGGHLFPFEDPLASMRLIKAFL